MSKISEKPECLLTVMTAGREPYTVPINTGNTITLSLQQVSGESQHDNNTENEHAGNEQPIVAEDTEKPIPVKSVNELEDVDAGNDYEDTTPSIDVGRLFGMLTTGIEADYLEATGGVSRRKRNSRAAVTRTTTVSKNSKQRDYDDYDSDDGGAGSGEDNIHTWDTEAISRQIGNDWDEFM